MDQQVKLAIEKSVLCWLATVDSDGMPNVSPKEIFTYAADDTLLIAHIASPQSVANIRHHAQVCVSFVDVFEQRGYKLKGTAQLVQQDDSRYAGYLQRLRQLADERFPIQAIIVISVTSVQPVVAPSYWLFADTTVEQQVDNALRTYKVSRP
ncbi:pyridoxamine 5'-phosphate oxidase family protein [Pokkaliibacter sp. MBI-7]|uniref:pyridoxamine 5'-phosphate oxidase family protein n=1 Tax=Pokkaliibacter sp. MBI-7 TaxID=3040600 RepID=UPI00244C07BA|nr:pyridoxamine 5'-phosphate oxidase family protein [Pokkaliibacter sp. MBI-7]MDH2434102.1 pyridoxamine 5'-phosphate oxidase family protein [Pokkaliibacter sp. MBI-7]